MSIICSLILKSPLAAFVIVIPAFATDVKDKAGIPPYSFRNCILTIASTKLYGSSFNSSSKATSLNVSPLIF